MFERVYKKAIAVIFFLILASLTIGSLFFAAKMNFDTYDQKNILIRTNFIVLLGEAAAFVLLLYGTYRGLNHLKNRKAIKTIIIVGVILVHTVLSVIWIMTNQTRPDADQAFVWKTAVEMANGECITRMNYFRQYPFQAGMIYPMKLLIELTGISDPIVWRVVNVFAVIFIDLGIISVSGELFPEKRDEAGTISAIILFFSVPMVVYTTYVYGTLVSLALTIWSMYGTIKLFSTNSAKWALLPAIFLPMANRVYSGTIIATIAISLAIFFESLTRKKVRLILLILVIMAGYLLSGKIIRHQFYLDTGIEETTRGVPATAYIYMGMTSDDKAVAGPGSYDESSIEIFNEYGDNSSSVALRKDIAVISEYIKGKRDYRFFIEKSFHQWSDPLFSSLSMTVYYFDEMSDEFRLFVYSKAPEMIYDVFLQCFNFLIFFLACVGGIFLMKSKNYTNSVLVLLLYFIGGFTFYFFWEAKSRYCLPYFVCLYPLAVYGLVSFAAVSRSIGSTVYANFKNAIAVVLAEFFVIAAIAISIQMNDSTDIEVNEMYSDRDNETLNYVDSSYDDDNRGLHSEEIELGRGMYDITVEYDTNLSEAKQTGAWSYINSKAGETVLYNKAEYGKIYENGKSALSILVPFDHSTISVRAFMDENSQLEIPKGETGYYLINKATIHKNNKKLAKYVFSVLMVLAVLIDSWMVYREAQNCGKREENKV